LRLPARSVGESTGVTAAFAVLAAGALFLSGCCPGGAAILSGLTVADEHQPDSCRLVSGPTLTSDPSKLMGDDPDRILDRSTAAAVSELMGGVGEKSRSDAVRYVYAAEYGCAAGEGVVGVAAVMFKEPTDAGRAARLSASPMGIMFKGQLAAIVWTRGPGCEECYRALREHAAGVIGREQ
jgi:hypothetical protein